MSLCEAYIIAKLDQSILVQGTTFITPATCCKPSFVPSLSNVVNNNVMSNSVGLSSSGKSSIDSVDSKSYAGSKNVRLTTSKEMESRRANGLCYWCLEKYSMGRHCKETQIDIHDW